MTDNSPTTDTATELGSTTDVSPIDSPAPTETSPSVFSEGLTFRKDWFQDYAEDPAFSPYLNSLSKYKDLPGLIKVAEDSRRQLSQRMDGYVKLPGEDASDDEISAYREKVGIPSEIDGYEFSLPDGVSIPEGIEVTAERQEAFAEFAHKAGLTKQQANDAFGFLVESELQDYGSLQKENEAAAEADRKELREVWGADYESRQQDARRVAASFGIDPSDPVLDLPRVAMAFAGVASSIAESKLTNVPAQPAHLSYGSQAKDIIRNESNPEHEAYHDRSHPQHNAVVQKVLELQRRQVDGEGPR